MWRFSVDGQASRLRIRLVDRPPGVRTDTIPLGHWWAYNESAVPPDRFVCFEYGRERARPACRYFQVDTLGDEQGRVYRELRLGRRFGGKDRVVELLRERSR